MATSEDPRQIADSGSQKEIAETGGQMTFFEHLVELRKRLISSLIAIAIGAFIGVYIAKYVINYFTHPTMYDTTYAQRDLAGSGITLPRFADYAQRLVEFERAHPEIGAAAMA